MDFSDWLSSLVASDWIAAGAALVALAAFFVAWRSHVLTARVAARESEYRDVRWDTEWVISPSGSGRRPVIVLYHTGSTNAFDLRVKISIGPEKKFMHRRSFRKVRAGKPARVVLPVGENWTDPQKTIKTNVDVVASWRSKAGVRDSADVHKKKPAAVLQPPPRRNVGNSGG